MPQIHVVERAFQLARSGQFRNLPEIRLRLHAEGYDGITAHLGGPSIKKQITSLCSSAGAHVAINYVGRGAGAK